MQHIVLTLYHIFQKLRYVLGKVYLNKNEIQMHKKVTRNLKKNYFQCFIILHCIWCTLWLSVEGHKSYRLHKRVDIKKQHIVTHHIYLYLINPTKYLLCTSDIYTSQPIICLLQIPTLNQSNVPAGMRPEHKEVSCGIRP